MRPNPLEATENQIFLKERNHFKYLVVLCHVDPFKMQFFSVVSHFNEYFYTEDLILHGLFMEEGLNWRNLKLGVAKCLM